MQRIIALALASVLGFASTASAQQSEAQPATQQTQPLLIDDAQGGLDANAQGGLSGGMLLVGGVMVGWTAMMVVLIADSTRTDRPTSP